MGAGLHATLESHLLTSRAASMATRVFFASVLHDASSALLPLFTAPAGLLSAHNAIDARNDVQEIEKEAADAQRSTEPDLVLAPQQDNHSLEGVGRRPTDTPFRRRLRLELIGVPRSRRLS